MATPQNVARIADEKVTSDITGAPITKYASGKGEVETLKGDTDVDPAAAFLGTERIEYSIDEGKKVLRKIDLCILPILCWVYCIQFADKTSLNYASVMGIRTDTHLDPKSQEYSWVSSIFYAGYIAWQ